MWIFILCVCVVYGQCPPGEQNVGGSCVACPDGQTSVYDGTCSATCASPRVAVGKKCVYRFTTDSALKNRIKECICGNTACGYTSTAWQTGAGNAVSGCGNEIQWYDISSLTDCSGLFDWAYAFNYPLNEWDTSSCLFMSHTFRKALAFNQPLNKWDVSSVSNMWAMFERTAAFNQDISSWDVSNVRRMGQMFYHATAFNQPLNDWDVSSVTSMTYMFLGDWTSGSVFNQELWAWDVSGVTDMSHMFRMATSFNRDLSAWFVSSATTMWAMFEGAASFDQDLSAWDVSSVTEMRRMFSGTSMTKTLRGAAWVSQVPNAQTTDMFLGTSGSVGTLAYCNHNQCYDVLPNHGGVCSQDVCTCPFPYTGSRCHLAACPPGQEGVPGGCQDCPDGLSSTYSGQCKSTCEFPRTKVGKKCVYQYTSYSSLYWRVRDCIGSGSSWATGVGDRVSGCGLEMQYYDVSSITDMSDLFNGAAAFNQPLGWDMSSVTATKRMFLGAASFNQPLAWDVSSVTDATSMFEGATSFNQPLDWDVSSLVIAVDMFDGATSFNQPLDWDVTSVTTMDGMFRGATSFDQTLPWNMNSVRRTRYMFEGTNYNGNVSSWDMSRVLLWNGMFKDSSFNQPVPWDTSFARDLSFMFHGATSFNQPMPWDTSLATTMEGMFFEAVSFNRPLSWDVTSVTNMNSMFEDSGINQPLDWDVSGVKTMRYMFADSDIASDLDWDVSSATDMTRMFDGTGMSLCGESWWAAAGPGGTALATEFGANLTEYCPCVFPHTNPPLCTSCASGYTALGGSCRNSTVSQSSFLAGLKGTLVGSARSKAVRDAIRPPRDTALTVMENLISVPVTVLDLSPPQRSVVDALGVRLNKAVDVHMSVAAPLTLSTLDVSYCHLDLATQEVGRKDVIHPYDVGHYVYLCDSSSGTLSMVAQIQETTGKVAIRCFESGAWGTPVTDHDDTYSCGGVPILLGSIMAGCGAGGDCCTDYDCKNDGVCVQQNASRVCVCADNGFTGDRCEVATHCAAITDSLEYQKGGCCSC